MQQQMDSPSEGARRVKSIPGLPADLPEHFFRKDDDPVAGVKAGELDLRQVTGDEARRLFQKMGIMLPVIHSMK